MAMRIARLCSATHRRLAQASCWAGGGALSGRQRLARIGALRPRAAKAPRVGEAAKQTRGALWASPRWATASCTGAPRARCGDAWMIRCRAWWRRPRQASVPRPPNSTLRRHPGNADLLGGGWRLAPGAGRNIWGGRWRREGGATPRRWPGSPLNVPLVRRHLGRAAAPQPRAEDDAECGWRSDPRRWPLEPGTRGVVCERNATPGAERGAGRYASVPRSPQMELRAAGRLLCEQQSLTHASLHGGAKTTRWPQSRWAVERIAEAQPRAGGVAMCVCHARYGGALRKLRGRGRAIKRARGRCHPRWPRSPCGTSFRYPSRPCAVGGALREAQPRSCAWWSLERKATPRAIRPADTRWRRKQSHTACQPKRHQMLAL